MNRLLDILIRVAFLLAIVCFRPFGAEAHESHETHAAWYKSQQITDAARKRLGVGFKSCCDESDHFKTRFRLVDDGTKYGTESYEYLTAAGQWKLIPPDIVQRKKTPDGRPVLFILKTTGREACFIVDEEGI